MPSGSGCGRIGGLPTACGFGAGGAGAGGLVLTTGRGEPVAVGFGLAPPVCGIGVPAGDEPC
jgi:hypothetical protein